MRIRFIISFWTWFQFVLSWFIFCFLFGILRKVKSNVCCTIYWTLYVIAILVSLLLFIFLSIQWAKIVWRDLSLCWRFFCVIIMMAAKAVFLVSWQDFHREIRETCCKMLIAHDYLSDRGTFGRYNFFNILDPIGT